MCYEFIESNRCSVMCPIMDVRVLVHWLGGPLLEIWSKEKRVSVPVFQDEFHGSQATIIQYIQSLEAFLQFEGCDDFRIDMLHFLPQLMIANKPEL